MERLNLHRHILLIFFIVTYNDIQSSVVILIRLVQQSLLRALNLCLMVVTLRLPLAIFDVLFEALLIAAVKLLFPLFDKFVYF
jgi:hypothetical protein